MVVKANNVRISTEETHDGIYVVYNSVYRVEGELADKIYKTLIKGQHEFCKFKLGLSAISKKYNCDLSGLNNFCNRLYRIYNADYCNSEEIYALICDISNCDCEQIQLCETNMSYYRVTGYKDKDGNDIYENDCVVDTNNNNMYKIIIEFDWSVFAVCENDYDGLDGILIEHSNSSDFRIVNKI